jgi:ferredoxin-NADP reductase
LSRPTYTARLAQKALLSESSQCFHLEFVIDELDHFDLTAGQFLSAVATDPNGKSQTRAYSIASASNGNRFDLCVNRVEGGFFSNHLVDLPIGGTVQVHGPHGYFTLRTPVTDSIFVATGTGIAPMRGFTQWLFPQQGPDAGLDRSEGRQIWLVYGTRHESELYYRDEFEAIAAKFPNFHYVTTLSRAPEEWAGLRGYVQEHVSSIVEKRGRLLSPAAKIAEAQETAAVAQAVVAVQEVMVETLPTFDIHTYICGLNNLVSAVRDRLSGFGWHKKQIIFERYD